MYWTSSFKDIVNLLTAEKWFEQSETNLVFDAPPLRKSYTSEILLQCQKFRTIKCFNILYRLEQGHDHSNP